MKNPELALRPASARGITQIDWLDSRHSFSFGSYHDPKHMGFRSLLVINDDRIIPSAGFGTHGHRNMEIVTYVLEGALAHRDSLGNGTTILPGEVQRMSAGSGIEHSEFNGSDVDPTRFLQIWIMPSENGGAPSYDQRKIAAESVQNKFGLIAAPTGTPDVLTIQQNAKIWLAKLSAGTTANFALSENRGGWLQIAHGEISVADQSLSSGDGASWSHSNALNFTALRDSEILLFDLA